MLPRTASLSDGLQAVEYLYDNLFSESLYSFLVEMIERSGADRCLEYQEVHELINRGSQCGPRSVGTPYVTMLLGQSS